MIGWWLSMQQEDSFFQKLQPLEEFPRLFSKAERFGKWNNKTLGIILVSFCIALFYSMFFYLKLAILFLMSIRISILID